MLEYIKSSAEVLEIARDAGKFILEDVLVKFKVDETLSQVESWIERKTNAK